VRPASDPVAADPPADCAACPRLAGFRATWRERQPDWHNGPVPTLLPVEGADAVRLLVVGLAPGLRGANRTGVPFTGDASGAVLFAALERHGLARDTAGAKAGSPPGLAATAITNAVRCVPPENRPTGAEIGQCRPHLAATIARFAGLRVILTLGRIAHDSTIRALGERGAEHPFGHGRQSSVGPLTIVSSYHCSRYNMNTGRLNEAMFDEVVGRCSRLVGRNQCDDAISCSEPPRPNDD